MASLTDLPVETLTHISTYLETSDLSKLALASQLFNSVVNPVLFRAIELSPEFPSQLFERSLDTDPALATLVRTLSAKWTVSSEEVHDTVNRIIGRLPELRKLEVAPRFMSVHDFLEPGFLAANQLKFVTEIWLSDEYLTMDTVADLFFLDNIKSLRISPVDDATPSLEQTL